MKGIVLLAHRSGDPQWVSSFENVRARVERRLPESATALAYLDHCPPDLMTAVDELIARGVTSIKVVPLFLGAGGHARVDVPQLVRRAMTKHPAVHFDLKPFIGDARTVLDAIADYAASDAAST